MQNPAKILQHLGAFWQHFGIHKRKSDFSGKNIVSVFSENCPYPVWHYDEWLENSNPPFGAYDNSKDFWEQIWELFSKCPIPHNIGFGNENSEYTDDCWYSKNCYLCHSLGWCEDLKYSYRVARLQDSYFSVFSFDSQLCIDLIYGFNCYNVKYAIDVKRCKNSAFLFDCQDCENCLLCWNLRNKKYCIANKEYSKEDYEKEIKKYDLTSRKVYDQLKNQFSNFIKKHAWWKAIHFDSVEKSTGDYLSNCETCENCYYIQDSQDCENGARSLGAKSSKYFLSILQGEKVYYSVNVQDNCFNTNYCSNLITNCKNLDYCMNCLECENCFLCNGIVRKKYHILNKEYSKEEYELEKNKIIEDMKEKGVYGEFFPAYFSSTSYNESLSGVYFPLTLEEQKKQGFRYSEENYGNEGDYKKLSDLPDSLKEISSDIINLGYWDEVAKRPFQILADDIEFYKKLGVAVNDRFYIRKLKENFAWMFPSFELRKTKCVKSGKELFTTLPAELDGRILSIEEYEKITY